MKKVERQVSHYCAWGPKSDGCGHMHRTATRALLCLVRDRHRQAKNGRYSDKRLYVSYDADERDKEWIETFEVMDDFEKSQHSSRSRVVAQ